MIFVRHTESRIRKSQAQFLDLDPDGLVEERYYVYVVKESPKTYAGNRTVLVPDDFMCLINKLIEEADAIGSNFLFTDKKGRRIATKTVRSRLKTINANLGIVQKSPHKLRKTYATILLDNHLDKNLVTALMGHTDIAVTEGHYHRDRKNEEQKSVIVNSLSEFKASTFGIEVGN